MPSRESRVAGFGSRRRRGRKTPDSRLPTPDAVYRVLDANLNRAREGLRVLEDTARFVWGSPGLTRGLRALRHRLDRATRTAYPRLIRARDSVRDPGRPLREKGRRDARGLVAANFRRAEEALRVLEEYGKAVAPAAAPAFKAVRYRLYAAEKDVVGRFF